MSGGNQRDNLALDIWLADSRRASAPNGAPSPQDYAIADRLIAKGYTMADDASTPSAGPASEEAATEEYDFGDPDPVMLPGTFVRSLQAPVPTEEIITAHIPTINSSSFNSPSSGGARTCRCGARIEVLHSEMDDDDSDIQPYLDRKLAAHITEALAAAGQEGTR